MHQEEREKYDRKNVAEARGTAFKTKTNRKLIGFAGSHAVPACRSSKLRLERR
jgi:hypothetical protein